MFVSEVFVLNNFRGIKRAFHLEIVLGIEGGGGKSDVLIRREQSPNERDKTLPELQRGLNNIMGQLPP